jgi:uncharacterized protein (UPF0335 family)
MSKLKGKASLGSGDFAKTDESKLIFREDSLSPNDLKESTENLFDRLEEEDYQRLKKDIKERGIIDPLICDNSFTLLTGNNRLSIAKELKLEKIPVRILQNNLSHKEKEKLHVLDNLNRRQLTYEQKIKFISMYYKEDLEKDNRGGNRKQKDKNEVTPKKENVAEKISKELGMSKRQAERITAKIRKDSKPTRVGFDNTKPKKVTKTDPNKKVIEARLKKINSELKPLLSKVEKLETEKAKLTKQLRKLK